ncbi:MAG: mandelate racemase/muconate lactonizing enzyme family protein [bacterium]|nr:mandelate racemase/muconate lactonizing enzyme family protein [bacterium]
MTELSRRRFIQTTALSTAMGAAPVVLAEGERPSVESLEAAAARPVLKKEYLSSPAVIESIQLYQSDGWYYVKARSKDGAEGFSITNDRAAVLYPLLAERVIPYFIGKDARELDALVDGVYVYASNYKLQGLALWCCVAWVEMSLLDLLGKQCGKAAGDLLGGIVRREISMYAASGNRNTTPQEEAKILAGLVERYGVRAVKFKVGGRMSHNLDSMPGRTEGLIPLARKTLGDDIVIFADSNGSYDPPKAIEVGRMLEDINAGFFEEPCPFDHLDDTLRVADALAIDVAGGECESSQRRFRWMVENGAVQIVQPDLHYYGGFIRAIRVARMAEAAGYRIVPHMGGSGVGFVEVLQLASCTPNAGEFHEFKGGFEQAASWYDPPLRLKDGAVNAPEGPGLGIAEEPEFMKKGVKVI